jgi:hypothetical protein
MEPLGWDKEGREYYVLDDNRLYRKTEIPVRPLTPPPMPKAKPKSKGKVKKAVKPRTKGTRSSKRRKVEDEPEEEEEDDEMADAEAGAQDETTVMDDVKVEATETDPDEPGYGFTDRTWECIAVTLEEYQDFLSTIFRSRDPSEKQLRKAIEDNILPVLEQRVEKLREKERKRQRELENLQKMATAKRSSRLAGKAEKEKEEQDIREAEERKARELRMAHEEQARQQRIEDGHESRRLTREQRLKEREVKRILHEEELARLEAEGERVASQEQDINAESEESKAKRLSQRQLKTQREQHRKELEAIDEQEKDWYFDCSVCGLNGDNLDDGSHSVACGRCNAWQHSECHGFTPEQVEKDDFDFVCKTCRRKSEDAKKPKIPSLKLGKNRASGSPEAQKGSRPGTANGDALMPTAAASANNALPAHVQRQLDGVYIPPTPQVPGFANGYSIPPVYDEQRQRPSYSLPRPPPPAPHYAPSAPMQHMPPQQAWQGSPLPPPGRPGSSGYTGNSPAMNGHAQIPPQNHQQYHQYAHQNAVQSSGGHPGYYTQPPQQHAYSHPTPTNMQGAGYPMNSPSPLHQYNQTPGQSSFQTQQPAQRQPSLSHQTQYAQPRPGSAQLMNGFQSPVKHAAPSSPAMPQYAAQPEQSPIVPSPRTAFPPPTNGYAQHAGHSPTKSSPPAPPMQSQRPPSLSFEQPLTYGTPGNGRPYQGSPLQGPPPHFSTPTQNITAAPPAPASAMASVVAADGMSGPWPESTKVIPTKHDQQPAPSLMAFGTHSSAEPIASTPGSVSGGGSFGNGNGVGGISGTPKLAPSPAARIEGPGSVPVKRDVDTNGNRVGSNGARHEWAVDRFGVEFA